ncbi:MAG: DUF4248 domain-containing protein [Bacteroidales bacterium]|nr:DUF4248 domain-containing protein [Bacteroidales bacterium]
MERKTNTPDTGNWEYAPPRAMWKSELARLLGYTNTTNFFYRYVHSNPALMKKLECSGYKKSLKWLTRKQVDLICDVMGYEIVNETNR